MLSDEERAEVVATASAIYYDARYQAGHCGSCGDIDGAIEAAITGTEHLMLKKAAEGLDWEKFEQDSETSIGAIYYDDNPGL